MGAEARTRSLEPEIAADGSWRRRRSSFRHWVTADGSSGFPAEGERYHLYVARACPWAHRTLIARWLMGLEEAVGVSYVDPIRDEEGEGWAFTGGRYEDPVNGFEYLRQAYLAADPEYIGGITVPVLWDKRTGTIVNNESADILRMLSTAFASLAEHPVELYPPHLADEIDRLNRVIYDRVNDGVYKCGFAMRQEPYECAVRELFELLDELDRRLVDRRFLFGSEPVETDWRLFTTLVRFDAVYQIHFKCSIRKLVEYEQLWPYARDLYQQPGVAATVDFDEIRAHYYRTHPQVNPSGIVAARPAASFDEPHDRARLG
ncbi:MAG TPA: glutathione S-transferase C-terminal domain-containing protein [Solirubrobacteraceae bacterium]|nr:glutathione S-transferase C-terminal domain-containing protein [Solirubrobacteraceae bacterium]